MTWLLIFPAVWACVVTGALWLVVSYMREQRRDRRVESAVFRAECEKARLEAVYMLPAFGEELA